jgi:hypothetical protein
MQFYKIDLITFLIKWSDFICMAKLTTFDKQMRVLEFFHSSTNLSKKTKIALFYATEGVRIKTCSKFNVILGAISKFPIKASRETTI